MSIIDNAANSVVAYDPKKSKAFTGQRLAKVTYKTINDKESPLFGIKRESKCVSIPVIKNETVVENVVILAPYVVEFLHGIQDKIIRERIDGDAKHITNEEISIASIIEYLDTNNESGRLTKETVGKWFDESIADNLMLVLADKLGVGDNPSDAQSKQIEAVVKQFKDKISSLAGGKTAYEPKVCDQLIKCLNMADAGDVMASRFVARLEKMKVDNTAINLLDAL